MLLQKTLSFFSLQNMNAMNEDELHDIRAYQSGDKRHAINRKKTAKYRSLMTNTYEPDSHIDWTIIKVISPNREKWFLKQTTKQIETFISHINASINNNHQNKLHIMTTHDAPSPKTYTPNKIIIISDFFWTTEQQKHFLMLCQRQQAKGIIVPLLTPFGAYEHPLYKKYPQYFWVMAE